MEVPMRGENSIHGDLPAGEASAEFAWRVHAAIEGWTARVDTKASILLAFQGGAFIFSATSQEVQSADKHGPFLVAAAGMLVLVIAMTLSAMAILPTLGSPRQHRAVHDAELIYFGHLRLWEPTELAARLGKLTGEDEMRALSAQLVRMSQLSWRKYRLLQLSIMLTLVDMVAMMVAMTLRVGI
jgi:hypothetical protein